MISPNTGRSWTFCADGSSMTYQSGTDSGSLESREDIWWNIHKTYTCQRNDIYDFTAVKQRNSTIRSSLNTDDNGMTFTDMDGSTTTANLPPKESVSPCEESCTVRIPVEDTQSSIDGTTADYRESINTYETIIRKCDNGVCPVSNGETIINDCGCTNYFHQAATMLQVIDDAGKDITCSSSPPQ